MESKLLFRFLARPTPLMSWERRWFRQKLLEWSDPVFRRRLSDFFWWLVIVGGLCFGFYLWSSTECALGRDCYFANADLGNRLIGK